MLIWINGAFGAGKTTVSEILLQKIPEANLFDPEHIGYVVQKTFPPARQMDYQDLPIWRKLVVQFIVEGCRQFPSPMIIPMTMVVPAYINEIFSAVQQQNVPFHHFFLHTPTEELVRRITNQVIIDSDPVKDEEVRQWRLAQIDRCVAAVDQMPTGTTILDTHTHSPEQLVALILDSIR